MRGNESTWQVGLAKATASSSSSGNLPPLLLGTQLLWPPLTKDPGGIVGWASSRPEDQQGGDALELGWGAGARGEGSPQGPLLCLRRLSPANPKQGAPREQGGRRRGRGEERSGRGGTGKEKMEEGRGGKDQMEEKEGGIYRSLSEKGISISRDICISMFTATLFIQAKTENKLCLSKDKRKCDLYLYLPIIHPYHYH